MAISFAAHEGRRKELMCHFPYMRASSRPRSTTWALNSDENRVRFTIPSPPNEFGWYPFFNLPQLGSQETKVSEPFILLVILSKIFSIFQWHEKYFRWKREHPNPRCCLTFKRICNRLCNVIDIISSFWIVERQPRMGSKESPSEIAAALLKTHTPVVQI